MTELGLIVGIDVVGLVLALLLWREVSVRDAGPPSIRRLGGALERAARAFLWLEFRLIAGAILVLSIFAAALGSSFSQGPSAITHLEAVFWTVTGLCLGALGASISGYAAAVLAVRGSVRTAAAASKSVDAALSVGMQSAGAVALLGETLSVLGIGSLFALVYTIKGGFALANEQAVLLAARVVLFLPSFALGAASAALVLQRGGGVFHAASGVGADQAGEREAGLEHDDARNPAVVAELVGDHVGGSATRVVDGFASASVANAAALIIGAGLSRISPGNDPLLILALPLVLRAFGVIASAFGILLVRSDEVSSVPMALVRGYLATFTIALVGLAGTTFWLLGERFLPFFCSGALGLVSVLLAAHSSTFRLGRRSTTIKDANDSLRVGTGSAIATALAAGLEAAWLPVIVLGAAVLLSMRIGAASAAPGAVQLCLLTFTLAALSVAPFVLAIATLGPILDGARGVANMSNAEGELRRRSARVEEAGFGAGIIARQYAILSGALASLLVAWAIAGQAHSPDDSATFAAGAAALAWCGALGAVIALAYAGSVARASARGAREVAAEVERQLRGFPRDHGSVQIPADYTPSYKACVELSAALSLRSVLQPIGYCLAAPFALGFGLRLLYRNLAPELVVQGLTWFVVAGSLTGLAAALSCESERAILNRAPRSNRVRDVILSNSIAADAVADIFGNAAGPALQLLVTASAAAALIITPSLL